MTQSRKTTVAELEMSAPEFEQSTSRQDLNSIPALSETTAETEPVNVKPSTTPMDPGRVWTTATALPGTLIAVAMAPSELSRVTPGFMKAADVSEMSCPFTVTLRLMAVLHVPGPTRTLSPETAAS